MENWTQEEIRLGGELARMDNWTEQEIRRAVEIYWLSQRLGLSAREVYGLAAVLIPGRNEGSIRRRMGNIAYVAMTTRPRLWTPSPHVGAKVAAEIRRALTRG